MRGAERKSRKSIALSPCSDRTTDSSPAASVRGEYHPLKTRGGPWATQTRYDHGHWYCPLHCVHGCLHLSLTAAGCLLRSLLHPCSCSCRCCCCCCCCYPWYAHPHVRVHDGASASHFRLSRCSWFARRSAVMRKHSAGSSSR